MLLNIENLQYENVVVVQPTTKIIQLEKKLIITNENVSLFSQIKKSTYNFFYTIFSFIADHPGSIIISLTFCFFVYCFVYPYIINLHQKFDIITKLQKDQSDLNTKLNPINEVSESLTLINAKITQILNLRDLDVQSLELLKSQIIQLESIKSINPQLLTSFKNLFDCYNQTFLSLSNNNEALAETLQNLATTNSQLQSSIQSLTTDVININTVLNEYFSTFRIGDPTKFRY